MIRWLVGLVVGLALTSAVPLEAQRASMDNGTNASLTSTTCPGTGCVTFDVNLNGSAAVQVTGTWTATLSFQGSIDGATFQTLNATPTNSSTSVTTTTANGLWTMSVGGLRFVRVVATAYTSGTALVNLQWAPSGGSSGGGGGGGGGVVTQPVGSDLHMVCDSGCGSPVATPDGTAFTAGVTNVSPWAGVFNDSLAVLTSGTYGAPRLTTNRGLHVNPRNAAGAELVNTGPSASAVRVTGANDANFRTSQIQQAQVTGGSLQAAATANGNGSALTTQGYSTVLLEIQCTACGGGTTINFEAGSGFLNFSPIWGAQLGTNTIATTTTAAGNSMWQFDVAGVTQLRARISGYSAGTITVDFMMLALPHAANVVNANAGTGTFTVGQGTGTNLHMVCDSGCLPVVAAASPFTEGTIYPFGTATVQPLAYVVDEVATNTVAEDLAGTPRMSTNRIPYADLSKSASNTNSFKVDFGGAGQPVTIATLPALTAGAALIGKVGIDQTTPGTTNAISLAQIGATTTATGNGTVGAGVQRVAIASDNTAFSVNANAGTNLNTSALALSATQTDRTQKTQITDGTRDGTVKAASTLPLLTDTAVVTTQRDPLPAGTNVLGHVIVDTTSTTTVTQATGTNLHIVCDSGCGSPAATADGTAFTAGSTNVTPTAGVFNDSIAALTTGTYGAPRLTANRALQVNLRDSYGLELGIRTNPTIVTDLVGQQQLAAIQKQGLRLAGTFGRAISSSGDALDVNVRYGDPCGGMAKASVAISQTANTRIVVGLARRVFICSILIVGADAENLSIVEGSGTTCGTGTVAVIGGTTAALGTNLAANGGWSLSGGGGAVAIGDGMDLCLLQSGAGRVAGVITYALAQ